MLNVGTYKAITYMIDNNKFIILKSMVINFILCIAMYNIIIIEQWSYIPTISKLE